MLRLDAAIARPAVHQHGLATRDQLRALGLTDKAIERRVRSGVLRIDQPGVFHHAATPYTTRSRLLAALLAAGDGAVASHRSAAVLHGFDGIRRQRPEIVVPGTSLPLLRDVEVHRTKLLDRVDCTRIDGIPTTSAALTLLHLGAVLPYEVVEHVTHVGLIEHRVEAGGIFSVLERFGRRGRNGSGVLRAVMASELPDAKVASMLEHDLHQLIKRARLPLPDLQYELVLDTGRIARIDFAWPALQLAIEADGHRWHATRRHLERDLDRSRAIQRLGWSHHRYGWDAVHRHAADTIAEIQGLLRSVST